MCCEMKCNIIKTIKSMFLIEFMFLLDTSNKSKAQILVNRRTDINK